MGKPLTYLLKYRFWHEKIRKWVNVAISRVLKKLVVLILVIFFKSDLYARVTDLKSSFEYTSLFCKVTLYAHAALYSVSKKVELKKIYLSLSCIQSAYYSAKKFWVALSYVLPLFGYKFWHLRPVHVLLCSFFSLFILISYR